MFARLQTFVAGQPDEDLLIGLRDRLDADLTRVIGRGARVALLDYPYSRNSGDAAIWLGERAALARLGVTVAYTCETDSYDARRLAAKLGPDGVILLHGGGNFGDYWPQHQVFREQVIADFPDHRIVQLPQSIGLTDPTKAAEMSTRLTAHPRLTVMCRDEPSLELARHTLGVTAELVPDAAFGIGPLRRPRRARTDFLVLARTDHEREFPLDELALPGSDTADWTLSRLDEYRYTASKIPPRIARRYKTSNRLDALTTPMREWAYQQMARQMFRAACDQLAGYRVVITDRLHAHVLSTLLGIPHVILDNSYGKIGGLHRAWTSASSLTRVAGSIDEARMHALQLLQQVSPGVIAAPVR